MMVMRMRMRMMMMMMIMMMVGMMVRIIHRKVFLVHVHCRAPKCTKH